MSIVELAVFMEDRVGRLFEVTKLLGDSGINICGFAVSDSGTGFGILRLIVNEHKKALGVLKEKGFVVHEKKVLCVKVPDEIGGLAKVLDIFQTNKISVSEMYAMAKTLIAFHVDNLEDAAYLLQHNKIGIVNQRDMEIT